MIAAIYPRSKTDQVNAGVELEEGGVMAKRKPKAVTLDELAKNPALLRTLRKRERARLARRFRRLFDLLVMREFDRLERARRLVEEWSTRKRPAGAQKPPRRRLRALPGGKANP